MHVMLALYASELAVRMLYTRSLFDSYICCLSQPVSKDGGQTAPDRRAGDEDAGGG